MSNSLCICNKCHQSHSQFSQQMNNWCAQTTQQAK